MISMAATALLSSVLLLLTTNVAYGSRKPSNIEKKAIIYAVHHDIRTIWPNAITSVVGIRVSTVDRRFARAISEGVNRRGRVLASARVLLWHGTKRWAIIDTGSENVGCGLVSAKLRRELLGTSLCV